MSIHQEITINCSPQKVYDALTQSGEFAKATGAPAEIDHSEGGAFSGFNGQVTGRNVNLKSGELIVQAWRAGNWPEGVYSIVRLQLEAAGDGTRLTLDQSGYPPEAEAHLDGGWHKMYWEPLKIFCE